MSDELFPELPGLDWDLEKTPMFNTNVMTSINGRELRASYQAIPKFEISMSFNFLRERNGRTELQQLEGFFIARRGSFDSFIFKMPDDNQFDCTFIGDGSTTHFQLYKTLGVVRTPLSHTDELQSNDPLMWGEVESVPMWEVPEDKMWELQYSVLKNGLLELPIALADGEELTVKGTYYYRCRFKDD